MSFDSHSARIAGAAQPTRPTLCLGWRSCTDPGHRSLIDLMIPRSHPNACAALLAPPYFRTGTLNSHAARSARVVPRQQQPRGRVWTRGTGLPSRLRVPLSGGAGYPRGVVARTLRRRAARAGGVLKRPRLYDDVRDLCSRPWHESRRRAARRLGSCSHFGASAAVASSSLASHKTHETGSIWLQRSASDLCAAVRHRSDCETTSSAAAETKSCCIQFCMALRRSIRCDRRC